MKIIEKIATILGIIIAVPLTLFIATIAIAFCVGLSKSPIEKLLTNKDKEMTINSSVSTESSSDSIGLSSSDSIDQPLSNDTMASAPPLANTNAPHTGDGEFHLISSSGTTENDNIPVIFIQNDTILKTIGYFSKNLDGSHLTYIYIDNALNTTLQTSEGQGDISLSDSLLSEGLHEVTVVQYDNDSTDGNIIFNRLLKFEVKKP